MKVTLIIPTINQTRLVDQCLESFEAHHPEHQAQIIVVDDGSSHKIQTELLTICRKHGAELICGNGNHGFSHSVNKGLEAATGDVMILVNNDIIFTQPILEEITASFTGNIGIVGCKLLYPDGKVQHAGVVRQSKTVFNHINKGAPSDNATVNTSKYYVSVTGALMAISRSCYERVGRFNEQYFVACEDTEYCIRTWTEGFSVWYNHKAEAIHIEGYTRGNTVESKNVKGPEWFAKEKAAITRFVSDLSKYGVDEIEKKINRMNTELSAPPPVQKLPKLEIGCGHNPQPGYIHMDVRAMPHVDVVHDFEKNPLPYKDGELTEILTNHVIEHISYRSLPFVLKEWYRTLKNGGRIFMRTPDLEFICKTYLEGKTTPEWPDDEKWIRENMTGVVTPAAWANLKLFAGQDYPSNFHMLCFDFDMLKTVLEKYGFKNVKRLNVEPVYSPGELQVEAYK